MENTKLSVKKSKPKPVSVFFVWYSELCRRFNLTPSLSVKPVKPNCQTILDITADRLKLDEWNPFIKALRQDTSLHVIAIRSKIDPNRKFLNEIDTEEKAKNAAKKYKSIWTAYVLRRLLMSLSQTLKITDVLVYLELEGLPLISKDLEALMHSLKRNKTLKSLSLSNCKIQDIGCQLVCDHLRFTPNIEAVNLSGCNLSSISGEYLAKLIKYQQLNRCCESWHNSLRYENPRNERMRGIKRITINCNPFFTDNGLHYILDELEDDLWVKALDMQKCGLTETITNRILHIIESNTILEIIDIRQNDLLHMATIQKVLQLLKQRQQFGSQLEFQWCATTSSLTWSSVYYTNSKSSIGTINNNNNNKIKQIKSAPIKNRNDSTSNAFLVHKTRTVDSLQNKSIRFPNTLNSSKKQVLELTNKLEKEIQKRKEIEKRNEELQNELNEIKATTGLNLYKKCIENFNKLQCNNMNNNKMTNGFHKRLINNNHINYQEANELFIKKTKNGIKTTIPKPANPKNHHHLKNGFTINNSNNKFANPSKYSNPVYNILQNMLNRGEIVDNIDYKIYENYLSLPSQIDLLKQQNSCNEADSNNYLLSNSQTSLLNYMEELKSCPN